MSQQKLSEKHYPLVLVTWYDSTTFPGWRGLDKMLELGPDTIQSTGFLLQQGEEFLTLVMSLSAHDNWNDAFTGMDVLVLPAKCVVSVEALGLVSSCGCGEVQAECTDESCGKVHKVTCCEIKSPTHDDDIMDKVEADCWGAPDPEYDPAGVGIVIPVGQEVVLEIKPGDDNLGRQLTLDEWMRRGGKVMEWPQLAEDRKKEEKLIGSMAAALERKLTLQENK